MDQHVRNYLQNKHTFNSDLFTKLTYKKALLFKPEELFFESKKYLGCNFFKMNFILMMDVFFSLTIAVYSVSPSVEHKLNFLYLYYDPKS